MRAFINPDSCFSHTSIVDIETHRGDRKTC